jgi:hypothetical protein
MTHAHSNRKPARLCFVCAVGDCLFHALHTSDPVSTDPKRYLCRDACSFSFPTALERPSLHALLRLSIHHGGRYYRRSDKQRITEVFQLGKLPEGFVLPDWDYNVAPATYQPVIRHNKDHAERELVMMRWGLIPHFAQSLADFKGLATINARAESLMKCAMWHIPFQRRRCPYLPMVSMNPYPAVEPLQSCRTVDWERV